MTMHPIRITFERFAQGLVLEFFFQYYQEFVRSFHLFLFDDAQDVKYA